MEETAQYEPVCVAVWEDRSRERPTRSIERSSTTSVFLFRGPKPDGNLCNTKTLQKFWSVDVTYTATAEAKTAKVQLPSSQRLLQCFYPGTCARRWRLCQAVAFQQSVVTQDGSGFTIGNNVPGVHHHGAGAQGSDQC